MRWWSTRRNCTEKKKEEKKRRKRKGDRKRDRKKGARTRPTSCLDTSLWLLVFMVTLVARCSPGIFPRDKRDYCLPLFADRSGVTCASTCTLFFIDRPHQRATAGEEGRDGWLKLRVYAFLGNALPIAWTELFVVSVCGCLVTQAASPCANPWQLLHFVSRTFIFALRERRCLVEHVTSLLCICIHVVRY